jgi:hypothetical protein
MRGLCHGKKSEPESLADQPNMGEEIDHSIAASNSSKNQWQMPTPINLDSSGLHFSSRTDWQALPKLPMRQFGIIALHYWYYSH